MLVQVPVHGFAFGIPCQEDKAKALYKDIAQGVEEDEVQFRALDPSRWRCCLPWDEMGIGYSLSRYLGGTVPAVRLHVDCDGLSSAFGCDLLLDGSLVAFAASLHG